MPIGAGNDLARGQGEIDDLRAAELHEAPSRCIDPHQDHLHFVFLEPQREGD
jgi:hypothetical protein